MGSQRWLQPVALALAALLIAFVTQVRWILALVGTFDVFYLAAVTVGEIRLRRERRYDLGALQRIHDREEVLSIEHDQESYDSVSCRNCGTVYNARLPICPSCKQSQFS